MSDITKGEEDRFWAKVSVGGDNECWLWQASTNSRNRYGAFGFGGRVSSAHRFSYLLHHGEIPEGMHVMHLCDVPQCVNPKHLALGTALDNMRDASDKGRLALPSQRILEALHYIENTQGSVSRDMLPILETLLDMGLIDLSAMLTSKGLKICDRAQSENMIPTILYKSQDQVCQKS